MQLSVKNFILMFFFTLGSLNVIIFALRELFPSDYWIGDAQVYVNTAFGLHLTALLVFLGYLTVITLSMLFLLPKKSDICVTKKNLKLFFIIISVLFILYSISSYFYGVGVAAAVENSAGSWQIFFYFISIDGLYFAYSLVEKNTKRFVMLSILYSISNILRGWASFVIMILMVYIIRNKPRLNLKKIIITSLLILPFIIILLYAREIFRGGTGIVELYDIDQYSGFNFYWQLLNHSLTRILTRFDFYSNYIGLTTLHNLENMSYPLQENIFYKILLKLDFVDEYKSLGSILPAHLYDWFIGKKTSFIVSSGFFALPLIVSLVYLLSNIFIFFISIFIINIFYNKIEVKLFFIQMIYLLFLQGWFYQYAYLFISFIMGLSIIKITRSKNVRNIRNK